MTIKLKLFISTLIAVTLVVTLLSFILVTSNSEAKIDENHVLLMSVYESISELDRITYDYLLHNETRMETQWNLTYKSLGEILKNADSEVIQSINADYITLGNIFSEVTENRKNIDNLIQGDASQTAIDDANWREEVLVSRLLITSDSMLASATTLTEESHIKSIETRQLTTTLTTALTILLTITIAGSSVLVINGTSKSLSKLAEYSNKVEHGDYTADMEFKGKDEISSVAANVKSMVNRLIATSKQLDKELAEHKQAEELLFTLAEKSPVGVYISQNNRFVYVNPQFQKYTGFNQEELLEKNPMELVFMKDRALVRKNAIQMLKGNSDTPYEFRFVSKSGETRWSLENTTSITYKGDRATMGNFMDITERKKIQEQLVVTDRLASIGELSSGIAHEINNPLTGVIGFSDLLLSREIPDGIKEDLEVINREARRTASIVKNLLIFARGHPEKTQMVNVNEIIQGVLDLRAYEQRVNRINVIANLDDSLPEIQADGLQLQQVFLNLVINAEYFMVKENGEGTLNITTENTDGIIKATFADDGPGISPENILHLFDPFFTTKEVGKGTGLGLSICHGIITKYNGRIYVESELGKGAEFIVELPVKPSGNNGDKNGEMLL